MKLHLGCGKIYIDGFTHVDLQDLEHVDYQVPVNDLDFAENDSVELIYSAHVLEHFGRNEYKDVLKEWHRALKPGGMLRISVPSFDAIVKYYTQKDDNLDLLLDLLIGGQKVGEYDYHKMIFNKKLLVKTLKEIGFNNIQEYDWQKTEHSSIDDFSQAYLPHMDKKHGMMMSLNLEAIKELC
ncbi:MAG: hypothetical protein Ctma_0630 [Catillopecten margaritatus gill symbiont]|uniref:Methyltransferase type 11 domain-containing protein n=1 Tax=Catillopecten margaritatus gill symbiont TaxID=3083288 RepID=A0AAU6PG01_9GAMM